MRDNFHAELDDLQQEILKMGTIVEEALMKAVDALARSDRELARKVIEQDDVVDQLQIDIERRSLALIALQQPIATDLRVLGTALKIVTDLERMADHASDISKVVLRLEGEALMKPLLDIPRMAKVASRMTHDCLKAYVRRDVALAREMMELDDEMDHLYAQIFRELLVLMMEHPKDIQQATHLLMVAQSLERVGDHATNLGEWIVYMVTGERVDLNA